MARRSCCAVLLLGVLASCGRSPERCRADADDLGRFLRSLDHDANPFELSPRSRLAVRDDLAGRALEGRPLVELTATEMRLDGKLYPTLEALEAALAAKHRDLLDAVGNGRHLHAHPPDPRALYFAIDRDVRWDRTVTTVAAAQRAWFNTIAFVFARTPAGSPPPRTWVDAEYDALPPDDTRYPAFIGLTNRVSASCTSLFQRQGDDSELSRTEYVIQQTPQALIDCNCAVDLAAFRSLMWHLVGNDHPTSTLELELDPRAPGFGLPGSASWAVASESLPTRPTETSFVVEHCDFCDRF